MARKRAKRRGRRPRVKASRERCHIDGCVQPAIAQGVCKTCVSQAAAGKRQEDQIFLLKCCRFHSEEAIARLKRHALVAHPVNIVRAVAAGLRGELE